MKRTHIQIFLISIILFISFSCSKETDEKGIIKEGTGTVWLSGGLAYCAFQIIMVKGDTLIPVDLTNEMKLMHFKMDDKVRVKYRELDSKESGCSIGNDCEIIEIKLLD